MSRRVLGANYDDLLNIKNNWMKNIVANGFFWVTLFLAVEEKVTSLKGSKSKTINGHHRGTMAQSVLFVFNMTGRAIHSLRALDELIVIRVLNALKINLLPMQSPIKRTNLKIDIISTAVLR